MKDIIEKSIKVLDEVIEQLPLDENKSKLIDLVIELRLLRNDDNPRNQLITIDHEGIAYRRNQ